METEVTIILPQQKLVTGDIKAERLTLEEVQELGVDIQNPLNWYQYKYEIVYYVNTYTKRVIWVPVTGGGTVYVPESGAASGNGIGGSTGGGRGLGYYITVYERGSAKLVTMYRYVEYLKKMYAVELTVTNNAEAGHGFDIINSEVKLNIPEGITPIVVNGKLPGQSLGTLAAQQTKTAEWYVRADEPGSYQLSVSFSGTLLPFNEPVQETICATAPLVVSEEEENTFCDDGFLRGEEKENYYIRVIDKDGAAVRGVLVTLRFGELKCMSITNSDGRAALYVDPDDVRHFTLELEKKGYKDRIITDYGLVEKTFFNERKRTDTVRIYRYNEDEENDDSGSDSADTDDYGISNPRKDSSGNTYWDCVYFGSYYQRDTNKDGVADENDSKEKIKWRVLSVSGNHALLLADECLDCVPYNEEGAEVTWENCTLRSWLNGYGSDDNVCRKNYKTVNFRNTAFSESENAAIIETELDNADNPEYGTDGGNDTEDKIFLLSINDVIKSEYGFENTYNIDDSARIAGFTSYALNRGANNIDDGDAWWWLRSPGDSTKNHAVVNGLGEVCRYGYVANSPNVSVRPVLYLDLESDVWSNAGFVSKNEKNNDNSTPNVKIIELGDWYGKTRLKINYNDLCFMENSTEYNHIIAEYAIGLSTMVYGTDAFQIIDGFNEFGYEATISDNYYPDPTTNSFATGDGLYSPCWIVHKDIILNGKETTLLTVVIRGTYNEEWIDNFEPGIDDTHEGFQRACDFIYENINQYVEDNNLNTEDKNLKILVTGHSRGAAVANLLGKKLDDTLIAGKQRLKKKDIFIYTFATPNVAKFAKEYDGYKNIYNIVNPEDFVTKVLLSKWGYSRYGTTYVLPSKTTESVDFYKNYLKLAQSEVNNYSTGTRQYEPYKKGMMEVSEYVSLIYGKVRNVEDYYNKLLNRVHHYSTLKNLYVYFLGYYQSGDIAKKPLVFELIANTCYIKKQVFGALGIDTVLFFIKEQLIDPNFENAHLPETYLAAMNVISQEDLQRDKATLYGIVNCPVDVTISDSNGEIVASIQDNEVKEITDDSIVMMVDGDSKMFTIPSNGDYTIRLTGNDNGVMNYSLCCVDADRGETGRIYYEEVPVLKGKDYTMEYTADGLLEGLILSNEDGGEVPVTATLSEDELGSLSYEVHVEGVGTADSIYKVTPGDYVKLQAYCDENNEFLGWYDSKDELITKELVYGFSAKESGEFTAKFTDVIVDAASVSVSESKVVLEAGEIYYNEATILPENATARMCSYISSNPDVARVDIFGVVTGISKGEAEITVTTSDGKAGTKYLVVVKDGDSEDDKDNKSDDDKKNETGGDNAKRDDAAEDDNYNEGGDNKDNGNKGSNTGDAPGESKNDNAHDNKGEAEDTDTGETGSEESEEVPDSGDAKKETGEAEDAGISGNGAKYITIAFDAMGGTSDKQSMRAEAGTTYGKLPEAAKNGYVFSGWYTAPDSGSRITAVSKVPVTTDQTLYARWEYIEIAVKQKYDVTEYFISEMNNANTNTSAVNGMDDIKGYLILEGKGKASVSGKGILTARKAGEVVIVPYMKQGKKKVPVEGIRPLHLIIRKPCASGKLILTSPGQMADLNDYLTNLPGNSNSIRWMVRTGRNPVITLTGENAEIVTPVRNGRVRVTAVITNDQNYMVKIPVTVTVKMPKQVSRNIRISVNKTRRLKFRSLTGQSIVWESRNPEIATVDSDGKVTGVTTGETVIVATIDGIAYEYKIAVK